MVVSIVAPHSTKKVAVQCKRCQRFGHTQKYCYLGPRCVKCIQSHITSECPRNTKDDKVKCVNCNGDHPANYKGCVVYQKLKEKLTSAREAKSERRPIDVDDYVDPNVSYASILKKHMQKVNPTKAILLS